MLTLSEQLGHFASDTTWLAAPSSTRSSLKLHLLDTLGCMVFGTQLSAPQELLGLLSESGGEYSVIGSSRRSSVTGAALCNATLGSSFELDSGGAFVHPGPPIVGSALAAAEYASIAGHPPSGPEFLAALLVGYEACVRVSSWVGFAPEHVAGWHTPAFHGSIGAAVAAGRLLDLSPAGAAHSIALAADFAGGGLIHSRNEAKRIHTGRAAESGLLAALLALRGIEGAVDVLENERWGYRRALRAGSSNESDTESLLAGIGTEFVFPSRLAFKYYPFHSAAQTIIDNVTALRRRHHIRPDQVRAICVYLTTYMFDHTSMLIPAVSLTSANFSLPYAAALALCHDVPRLSEPNASLEIFLRGIHRDDVISAQRLVEFNISTDLDQENEYSMDTLVEITTSDGVYATRTDYGARGRAAGGKGAIAFDEMAPQHITDKFRNLSVAVLGQRKADEAIDLVSHLDDATSIQPLFQAVSPEQ